MWESLRWKAERILATTPEADEIPKDTLETFEKEVAEARKQAPTIHNDHWDEAAAAFKPSKIE